MLETQQQLAVAVSVDKKKDAMIEQLDKTLSKLVDGWKKQEAEKQEALEGLKTEKEGVDKALEKAKKDYESLVADQNHLAEQLQHQMVLLKRKDAERQAEIQRLKAEAAKVESLFEKEKKKVSFLPPDFVRMKVPTPKFPSSSSWSDYFAFFLEPSLNIEIIRLVSLGNRV